jgi:tetratricopeptide (TPR) repeat protein
MATVSICGYAKPRTAGIPLIEGVRISRLADLDRIVGTRSFIATDLSLGPWRGCQAAEELEAQAGLTTQSSFGMAPSAPSESMPAYADFIGRAIDGESSGDQVTFDALKRASRLADFLRRGPVSLSLIFAPCPGIGWDRHDALLIRFLAEALGEDNDHLMLVSGWKEEPFPLPDCAILWSDTSRVDSVSACNSLLGLVPGIVDHDVKSILGTEPGSIGLYRKLSGGRTLLGPELRRHPTSVTRNEYDRFAAIVAPIGWLAAYAQCYGNNFHVSPSFLCEQARFRLAEGGNEIALRLIDRAAVCSHTPEDVAKTQSCAQGTRIALMRFKEAALCSDPPRSIPAAVRSFLLQCKGWGLVMCDDAERAASYLNEARLLASDDGSREYLYLLNISALAAYKRGDFDGALKLERFIEDSLAVQTSRDWHLRYINSINSARLHFRSGANEKAAAYYDRAFETTLGVRSESDRIYANVCRARVLTRQSGLASALPHWLRASLHWAASDVPETLAPRVMRGILRRSLGAGEHPVEAVSAALIEQLLPTIEAAGIGSINALSDSRPVFLYSAHIDREILCAMGHGVGIPGCGIVAVPWKAVPVFSGEYYDRLREVLWQVLGQLIPGDWEGQGTVVIDDRFGLEIPATKAELLGVCVRLAVPRIHFGGKAIELDESLRSRLEMQSVLRLGQAVDHLKFSNGKVLVSFRRYLPSRVFTGADVAMLADVANGPVSVDKLLSALPERSPDVLARLRSLERLRVVAVELENGDV